MLEEQAQSDSEQRLYINNLCTQMKIIVTGLPKYAFWSGRVFVCVRGIEACIYACACYSVSMCMCALVWVCVCVSEHVYP